MAILDKAVFFNLLADLLVNLSAGWFGIVLITSAISPSFQADILFLTKNLIWGIIYFAAGYILKEEAKI